MEKAKETVGLDAFWRFHEDIKPNNKLIRPTTCFEVAWPGIYDGLERVYALENRLNAASEQIHGLEDRVDNLFMIVGALEKTIRGLKSIPDKGQI